jgi:hypothetical protein
MVSFLYQELVGGAVFLLGMFLVWRSTELGWSGRRGRRVWALVGGLLLLALIQGALQILALS